MPGTVLDPRNVKMNRTAAVSTAHSNSDLNMAPARAPFLLLFNEENNLREL